jgi:2-polyprenyl-6-methoxyphenol hydroxylase-like FAD-dependent oxidoreductase
MTRSVEIAIVGGGLAGVALGVALSRRGIAATVLERSVETPELLRGELIMPAGVAVLERLGLASGLRDVCVETEGTVLHHPAFDTGVIRVDYALAPAPEHVDPATWRPRGLCGWRRPLYEALAAEAVRAGVEVVRGFEVVHAARDGDRIALEPRHGEAIAARLVVACDGANSLLRRAMGFEPVSARERTLVQGFVARSPRPWASRHVHVGACEQGAVFVFPFPDGCFRTTIEHHRELRGELAGGVARHLEVLRAALPGVWEELGGEAIEPRTDLQVQPGRDVVLAGLVEDGFALAGDAAGSLDPFTGFGMSLALADAEVLAEVIADARSDYRARNLRPFERRKHAALASRREATEALAYLFLDKAEGFAAPFAEKLGARWRDASWILPLVAVQFAGFDPPVEPSVGMRYHFQGLL